MKGLGAERSLADWPACFGPPETRTDLALDELVDLSGKQHAHEAVIKPGHQACRC